MATPEKANSAPVDYMTRERFFQEMRYYDERITELKKKIRLLVRLLVDKKIIGEELAKSFEETSSDELIEWYENRLKNKKQS